MTWRMESFHWGWRGKGRRPRASARGVAPDFTIGELTPVHQGIFLSVHPTLLSLVLSSVALRRGLCATMVSSDADASATAPLTGSVSRPLAEIVVGIPCYNEAPALPAVVAEWRAALPEARLIVFDNNSTDGTAEVAHALGVEVRFVAAQGKGHVVQAMFRDLLDHPILVMVDGDGTYPASEAVRLVEPIRAGRADMTVGARRPVDELGAMAPTRRVGNLLIRAAFRVLIGPGASDLLSGYRAFNQAFRRAIQPRSPGFAIETELAAEAVTGGWRVESVPVPYHPRAAGTVSKLNAVRDGLRILARMIQHTWKHRPHRLLFLGLMILALVSAAIEVAALVRTVW